MPIRIIHIGTGSRGRHWLEIVQDYADAIPVAYVDKDPKALDEARKLIGNTTAGFFTDLPKALREVSADAALIATPSALHAEHALQALESGLAVLTEKPFTTNLSDAFQVIDKAETIGKHVVVAENYRFFAAERTIRQWIAEDRLGRIATVTCVDRRNQPPSDQGPWVTALDYPQLAEIAVHHFDSFRFLFHRNPVSMTARAFNPPGSHYRNGAATEALIEMEENLSILYFGTLTSHRYEYGLWIEGEKGSLWSDRKRVWWRKKGWRFFVPVKLVSVPKGDELRYPRAGTMSLLNHLRDAILHNKEPETSGRDNFWSLTMVEAAKISALENRRVSIAEVSDSTVPTRPASSWNGDRSDSKSVSQKTMSAPLIDSVKKGRRGSRVMVIGWDSADAELIEQWCAEGLLPNISRMKSRGTWARMQTTAEVVHVSAWPSIFTGTTPDKHGLYHAYVMCPGHQSPLRPRPDQSPFPFLWKYLSDQGKRCVIMDAFLTCPLQDFNGAQIVDWGSWSKFWEPTILPASLKNEIEKKFGSYPAEDHSRIGMTPLDDCSGFYRRLLEAVSRKAAAVKWLMEREDWDFFLVVFGESHPIGHYFWHFHDPSHPAHAVASIDRLRHALRGVYVALDRALGQIMECVDERTTVLLVSGDGMGPNYSGSHILSDLLARMGLLNNSRLVSGNGSRDMAHDGASAKKKTDLLSLARQMIPPSLRARVAKSLFPRSLNEKLSLKWKTAGISWNQTRAFLIDNANEGYIRINLKGREPQGIVEPGKDYEDLCEEIRLTCEQMINPANGRRAARTVYKTADFYRGPCRSHMPDIIINWDEEAQVTTELLTEKYGLARSKEPGWGISPYYTGNHRANAFAVVTGPDVAEGQTLEGASILDLTPNILARLGVEPPAHMDGRILGELSSKEEISVARLKSAL
jgi:predicted dehydrogenase/predicted AlkP superfamily phosphohydrolase/phosphomutase